MTGGDRTGETGEAEGPVAPCVRVPRENGEETRRDLAEAGVLDDRYEITVEDGWIYVPVLEHPEGYEVVERPVTERDGQTTPADLLAFDPTYERLGDVVILDEEDPDRARRAAEAVMESDVPVATVVRRASEVQGELRLREFEVLAGDGTETVHREYGCEYLLDLQEVYFSPRLATERHRVAEQVRAGEQAFDMFAGVGPFVVPFAARGADCVGVDLNEAAVEYLRENCRRNGVVDLVTVHHGDVREIARDPEFGYEGWADRVVMNLPHSADEFLDTAVGLAGEDCLLHYYDIQSDEDPYGPGERAIREAAGPEYDVEVETRRTVRSHAPHELNVVLDVRLTR
ncbi:SAM-dependent methyltransferase [Halobacteriales archaeon QS_8_69_26]|nr:MAG: SAM-dependent methyltransferase [Halobacteriales archaeon QS_8_69_26]